MDVVKAASFKLRKKRPQDKWHFWKYNNLITVKARTLFKPVKKNCAVYGQDVIGENGPVNKKNVPCSGRSVTQKADKIIVETERNRHVSSCNTAKKLGIYHQTVLIHL